MMSRLMRFLIGLAFALSLGMGATAHAAEAMCLSETESTMMIGHAEGDSDQVPADAGKGYSHHHGGCHGHQVVAAVESDDGPIVAIDSGKRRPASTDRLTASATDPALRPPIA